MKFWEWAVTTIVTVALTVATEYVLWLHCQPFKEWLSGILGVGG